MFKNLILKKVMLLIFIFFSTAHAELPTNQESYLNEALVEDVWTVRVNIFENLPESVIANVNGKITHGDKLSIRVPIEELEYCDYGNIFTTFYTTAKNPKLNELDNKIISAVFKDEKVNLKIITSVKAMLGDVVFIDMGWNNIESIKSYFQNREQVSIELKSGDGINAFDYFDILKNTFVLNGLNEALDRAKNECLKIVKQKESSELGLKKTNH
jgi:hypothetical protein